MIGMEKQAVEIDLSRLQQHTQLLKKFFNLKQVMMITRL